MTRTEAQSLFDMAWKKATRANGTQEAYFEELHEAWKATALKHGYHLWKTIENASYRGISVIHEILHP